MVSMNQDCASRGSTSQSDGSAVGLVDISKVGLPPAGRMEPCRRSSPRSSSVTSSLSLVGAICASRGRRRLRDRRGDRPALDAPGRHRRRDQGRPDHRRTGEVVRSSSQPAPRDGERDPAPGGRLLRQGRPPKMNFPLVRDLAAEGFPVRLTCGVLGFSPQAFYGGRPNLSVDVTGTTPT